MGVIVCKTVGVGVGEMADGVGVCVGVMVGGVAGAGVCVGVIVNVGVGVGGSGVGVFVGGGAATSTRSILALSPCWSSNPLDGSREQLAYPSAHIHPRIWKWSCPGRFGVIRRANLFSESRAHWLDWHSTSRWRAVIVAPLDISKTESPVS